MKKSSTMLAKRAASAVTIIVFGVLLVLAGGWVYTLGVGLILALAAREYASMFEQGGYRPASALVAIATFLVAITARFNNPEWLLAALGLFAVAGIAWHIFAYPKHPETAGIDLAATLSAIGFVAFLGSYIVRLRFLPDGMFWLLLAIAPAGISDIGAYLIGSAFGRTKMARALSPHKTIEGYLGGVLTAALTGLGVGALAHLYAPAITGPVGLLIGLVVGLFCPLGDLGKSVLKRHFNLKHTGDLIPGHGGVLDRVDTWLWAGIISYYLITLFFL